MSKPDPSRVPTNSRGSFLWAAVRAEGSVCFNLPSLLPACSQHAVVYVFFRLQFGLICLRILCLLAFPQPAAILLPAISLGRFLWTAVRAHSSACFMPRSLLRAFPACSRKHFLGIAIRAYRSVYFMHPNLLLACSQPAVVNVFFGLPLGQIVCMK